MRRLQVYMDEALDDALEAEASRRGVSKARLIRQAVAREFAPQLPPADDPWMAMIGSLALGGIDDIDEVLYGPQS